MEMRFPALFKKCAKNFLLGLVIENGTTIVPSIK
jgi:hypothetical protein